MDCKCDYKFKIKIKNYMKEYELKSKDGQIICFNCNDSFNLNIKDDENNKLLKLELYRIESDLKSSFESKL